MYTNKTTLNVADAVMKVMEAEQKAKMDHDKDGKIESGKDEYLGSRIRAAKMAGKLKEEDQLDEISTKTLAKAAHAASDPDADYVYGMKKSIKHDPQKFADHAKKTKDAKSADAVQGAADAKGHYPRPGHSFGGYDKLKSRENRSTNPSMVTKAGKLSKTSVKGLKSSLKEEEYLEEGGMPSSVIKHKQRLAAKTPEELHAGFKEVADRMGKSVEHVARSLAWSHGYGKGQGQGSSHYYDKVKHLEPKSESVELDEAFPTVADGEKSLKAKEGKTSKGTLIKTKTGVRHERDYDDEKEPEVKRGRGRPKKRLSEMRQEWLEFMEEVDNETFTKELKDQKAKFDGKKKGADVAKPSVQAVKQEEVEQIDELSKGTLGRYIKKAHFAGGMADFKHGMKHDKRGDSKEKIALAKTSHKREKGINKAVDRLVKKD